MDMLEESIVHFVVREIAFNIIKQFFWHFVSSSFEFLIRFGVIVTIKEVYDNLFRRIRIILYVINVLECVHENVINFMHI